ncbi:uncharacterized protein E5676_scaffold943G00480 [Cucumis melo var. makuwa]|uniref:Uncharacterized protein n=1 Tax=Cucumis melo var. makuwa TaxID=1194695 RepID=A0A5A7UKZ4_CUCMM|nr:uncharacterized protein E6C27_scaffold104G00300 [Cucumis melo var. makuwa]TYK24078.1 uncharacterized protein E5676_scaffold943G00480 [Cucumis melo var. makuwa]
MKKIGIPIPTRRSNTNMAMSNPLFQVVIASYSSMSMPDYFPASLFPRRSCYGKPISKDEAERSGGERSKAERAPSTAEEFNRMATEKESKDQEEEVDEHDKVTKESGEMEKSSDPNNHINKGPNYRPCS